MQVVINRLLEQIRLIERISSADLGLKHQTFGLFRGVSLETQEYILEHSVVRPVPEGEIIVNQGDEVKTLYFILYGKVKTSRYDVNGNEAVFRMLEAGETFMDAVIFMGGASPIGASALSELEILEIPAAIIKKAIMRDSQIGENIMRIVTNHYKTSLQQIDSIATKHPEYRLGVYLLGLFVKQLDKESSIILPFPKAVTARHLGMTPETFSRALKKLRDHDVIEAVDNNQIALSHSFALCEFCDHEKGALCVRHDTDECPLED